MKQSRKSNKTTCTAGEPLEDQALDNKAVKSIRRPYLKPLLKPCGQIQPSLLGSPPPPPSGF